MNPESKLLIGALRRSVTDTIEDLSFDVDWKKLLELAQSHMLLPLLYNGLKKVPADWARVPENAQQILHRSFMKAVYWDAQMEILAQSLREKLKQEKVPHIFLKGAVLREDYPIPALRTMCDFDILVHTEDYPRIDVIAQNMGGKMESGDGNHHNFRFPGGVVVEFHPNLIHHDTPVGTEINPGWQYANPDAPDKLTEEGFYLNTLCHLANHFVAGGVGVRFVLDVWVNRYLRKPEANRSVVEKELERVGLLDFAQKIEALAQWWFGTGEGSELLEELGEYILTSGSHGRADRAVLNAVSLSAGGTRSSALWGKMFYSREELEDRFPWCKGKPWLLPAAWCTRAFRVVTQRWDLLLQWSKDIGKLTNTQIVTQKEKLKRFGIEKEK